MESDPQVPKRYLFVSWMIVMQLNIDVRLQMTVASNCSNFTSFDPRVKLKTALNRAEVNESNENSFKSGKRVRMAPNLLQK